MNGEMGMETALKAHLMTYDNQPEQLLRYHPNRYYQSREFFGPLYNYYRSAENKEGILSVDAFDELAHRFISNHWRPTLLTLPLELRPKGISRLSQEVSLFSHVARFQKCGRNIFHFSPALKDLLLLTDVDDVFWHSIKLPYPSIYIWFGQREGWSFVGSEYSVDGAYVSEIFGQGIEILVTTYRAGLDYSKPINFVLYRDAYYYVPFQNGPDSTVGQSLSEALRDDSFNIDWTVPPIDEDTTRLAARAGVEVVQAEEPSQRRTARENVSGLPVFREVLRLIINCLCYLSSPGSEVQQRFPEETLEKEYRLAPDETEKQRVIKRAGREGFTRINFCGLSLERSAEQLPTGREVAAHWRRGHWRNQAFGESRAEHKLLWIRPTLVRKDKASEAVSGHIYRVTQQ